MDGWIKNNFEWMPRNEAQWNDTIRMIRFYERHDVIDKWVNFTLAIKDDMESDQGTLLYSLRNNTKSTSKSSTKTDATPKK